LPIITVSPTRLVNINIIELLGSLALQRRLLLLIPHRHQASFEIHAANLLN